MFWYDHIIHKISDVFICSTSRPLPACPPPPPPPPPPSSLPKSEKKRTDWELTGYLSRVFRCWLTGTDLRSRQIWSKGCSVTAHLVQCYKVIYTQSSHTGQKVTISFRLQRKITTLWCRTILSLEPIQSVSLNLLIVYYPPRQLRSISWHGELPHFFRKAICRMRFLAYRVMEVELTHSYVTFLARLPRLPLGQP